MKKSGFTLVELLVVILIIAILATIGLVMYSGVQKSARIAKRIEDLKAIQTALELYYSRNNSYPIASGGWSNETTCFGLGDKQPNEVIPGLVPTYMPAFPSDPSMNKTANCSSAYLYQSDGTDYKLLDHDVTEMRTNSSADYKSQRNLIDPARDGGGNPCIVDGELTNIWSWAVYSSCDPTPSTCDEGSCRW